MLRLTIGIKECTQTNLVCFLLKVSIYSSYKSIENYFKHVIMELVILIMCISALAGLEITGLNIFDEWADKLDEKEMAQERERKRLLRQTSADGRHEDYPSAHIEIVSQLKSTEPIELEDVTLIPVAVKVSQEDLVVTKFCHASAHILLYICTCK